MMRTGAPLAAVLDLDVLTFNALVETLLRMEYHEKIEMAWTLMVASQGREKDMRKWVARWEDIAGLKRAGTARDFLKDFGSF